MNCHDEWGYNMTISKSNKNFKSNDGAPILEISLCQTRHETIGLNGCKIRKGIFPQTVENIFDFEEHIKTIDRTLSILPKETKVIIYLTGLTILTQAIYVWINRKKPFLDIELILAHYERREQNHIYYLAETGKRISHQYFL